MDLNTLWFVLIAVLFTGFFVLEGFDYGVGILLPFVAKTDSERRRVVNTIGPVWDGNEVWILTGGGAIFAAFGKLPGDKGPQHRMHAVLPGRADVQQ
jgi:cytochrome d ubiquinol oxidase subunit II